MESTDFTRIQGEVDMCKGRSRIATDGGDNVGRSEYLAESTSLWMLDKICRFHMPESRWLADTYKLSMNTIRKGMLHYL